MFPFHQDQTPYYLSIDGGTTTAGFCYFTVEDNQMKIQRTTLLDISRIDPNYTVLEDKYGALSTRIKRMEDLFITLLDSYPVKPVVVYYESHFINPRRPNSVIPLVRFMQMVESTLMARHIPMVTIAPQRMKAIIGVKKLSIADKDSVKQAIQAKIEDYLIHPIAPLESLSEHEIDAIGIGYTGVHLDCLIEDYK